LSSTSRIFSQASASSYPPPAAVPLTAAIQVWPEWAVASSISLRVSLVNLQKFTFHGWLLWASIRMLAPAQKLRSFALVSTTARTCGWEKRSRWTASCSSMSTPRS
jgi:hypothetical protein